MSSVLRIITDPLRGVTPLWKVAVLYSIVGGGILGLFIQIAMPAEPSASRIYGLVSLMFGAYITIATYRCAANCGSPELARLVRLCAGLSLALLPFMAYLLVTGRTAFGT
jgi:hypothetical protein